MTFMNSIQDTTTHNLYNCTAPRVTGPRANKMELRALFALVASVNAIKFGTYECNNNCANNEKYGKVIGTAQATEMSNVGVFGAYHGNLY